MRKVKINVRHILHLSKHYFSPKKIWLGWKNPEQSYVAMYIYSWICTWLFEIFEITKFAEFLSEFAKEHVLQVQFRFSELDWLVGKLDWLVGKLDWPVEGWRSSCDCCLQTCQGLGTPRQPHCHQDCGGSSRVPAHIHQQLSFGKISKFNGRRRSMYMYCWLYPVFWVHGLWPKCYGCHLSIITNGY